MHELVEPGPELELVLVPVVVVQPVALSSLWPQLHGGFVLLGLAFERSGRPLVAFALSVAVAFDPLLAA